MRRLALMMVLLGAAPLSAAAQQQPAADLAERLHREARAEVAETRAWAALRGLPLRIDGPERTLALAALRDGRPRYLLTANAAAGAATRTDLLHAGGLLGLALDGAGLDLGIWDAGGVASDHRELAGRVTRSDDALTDDHATHVGGTLAAAGLRAEARGMAPAAQLLSYDWTADFAEMAEEAREGLLVSNHSYGIASGWTFADLEDEGRRWYWLGDERVSDREDYLFGRYDAEAAAVDEVAYTYPYLLPVVAAGNDRNDFGPTSGTYRVFDGEAFVTRRVADGRPDPDGGADGFDSISGMALGKNVLAVGAVGPDPDAGLTTTPFSSYGPADDGRVKPDLVGYGARVLSTLPGRDAYGRYSGTSMAAPNVAGSLLLLQQHHRDVLERPLTAAALRALAIHTARDLDMPGPDPRTGWGLLDAARAAAQIDAARTEPLALVEDVLPDGDRDGLLARVDSTGPLRVTLAWTDPPSARRSVERAGLNDQRPHLVHDLDLRVRHLATDVAYAPYRLDPARPYRAASTTGDNDVDNVEQVFVADAPPGLYLVEITHEGRLVAAEQPYALLVSGARSAPRPVVVDALEARPAEDRVQLTWTTRAEREAATFVLERAHVLDETTQPADDAFEPVAEMPSAEVAAGHRYAYEHRHVLAGRYRYRLVVSRPPYSEVVAQGDVQVLPPRRPAVHGAYPQPARDRLTLVVDVPTNSDIALKVFDVAGRRVLAHAAVRRAAGRHHLPLDTAALAPGLYVARFEGPEGAVTHPFVVVR